MSRIFGEGNPLRGIEDIGAWARDPMKSSRDDANKGKAQLEKDAAEFAKNKAITDALGQKELGFYEKGLGPLGALGTKMQNIAEMNSVEDLPAESAAAINAQTDKFSTEERAKTAAFLAAHGMTGSSTGLGLNRQISSETDVLKESLFASKQKTMFDQTQTAYHNAWTEAETHYQNAVQALGLSNQSMRDISAMHQGEMQIDMNLANQKIQAFTKLVTVAAIIASAGAAAPAAGAAGAASGAGGMGAADLIGTTALMA